MRRFFNWFATKTSTAAGQPLTFVVALLVILVWAVTGPVFRLFRHLAADYQYRNHHRHVPDGVPDPEQPEPRRSGDAGQARRAAARGRQGARVVHRHRAFDRPARSSSCARRSSAMPRNRAASRRPRTIPSTGCSTGSSRPIGVEPRASALQFLVGFIDRAKQFAETRRILDRPNPVEGGTQRIQITLGQQADGYDALVHD